MAISRIYKEDDKKFDENIIKARIAETIVEQMFIRMGYKIYRYGMENTIPGIMDDLRYCKPKEIGDEIRKMPDFILKDPNDKSVYYVEVKFRADGKFKLKDLGENYPYKNAYILVVSKKHIRCMLFSELEEAGEVTSEIKYLLGYREDFKTNRRIILHFCELAKKYFSCVK